VTAAAADDDDDANAADGGVPPARGSLPLRVAYVTSYDARDMLVWSGTGNRIGRTLTEAGLDVQYVGPLAEDRAAWFKVKHAFHKLVLRASYARQREPRIVRGYARQTLEQIRGRGVDVVFSPGQVEVSLLDCPQPIVTWADATFAQMVDYYPGCARLTRGSVRLGLDLERQAFGRVAMSIFASSWAAESAVRDCGADPARVCVVPFGANVADPPSRAAVEAAVAARPTDRCRLLFIAIDLARKGFAVAVEAAEAMNRAGLPTELTVVGGTPDGPVPPFVKPIGFVKKSTPDGRATMDHLLATSHFLVLPSKAEAYGLAPAEANAYGIPGMTSDTGGLSDVVRAGVNGQTFPVSAGGAAYAEAMRRLLADPSAYRALCLRSRDEYEQRLNWGVAGRRVREILERVVATSRGGGAPTAAAGDGAQGV
jgi:glycosyltransferase involved in cell wall biosynthesis